MASNHAKDPTRTYMAEVIAAVATAYFLLGGYAWSPVTWAFFTVVAVWIVLKEVRRQTGLESEESYQRWNDLVGLSIVIALLASPLWLDSWWPFLFGLVLGALWLDDWRLGRKSSNG